jgi:putative phosphoribosyl transferase
MFADRIDAGQQLAEKLVAYEADANAIVLGIPRGGVVVADQVARALGLPLDVVIAAKIGAPGNPEYAVGAVAADGVVLANPDAGFSAEALARLSDEARGKVSRRLSHLRAGAPEPELDGRTAIVVDDGLATGLTARAAVGYLRRQGVGRVVLAVPVASTSAAQELSGEVDELVAVDIPPYFAAVGQFYSRFGQTEDAEVERLLAASLDSGR